MCQPGTNSVTGSITRQALSTNNRKLALQAAASAASCSWLRRCSSAARTAGALSSVRGIVRRPFLGQGGQLLELGDRQPVGVERGRGRDPEAALIGVCDLVALALAVHLRQPPFQPTPLLAGVNIRGRANAAYTFGALTLDGFGRVYLAHSLSNPTSMPAAALL